MNRSKFAALKNFIGLSDVPSTATEKSEENTSNELSPYPDEVFYQVFLRCDKLTILMARRVCKRFDHIINNHFWLEKCEQEKITLPPAAWRRFLHSKGTNFDYMFIYCHYNPYAPNVLSKLWNEHPEQHEQALIPYGKIWRKRVTAECPPIGSRFNDDIKACYATSYGWGQRLIEIDLQKLGVESWVLDYLRPRIVVKEFHAPRNDCGCTYEFDVQLLKSDETFDRMVELSRFKKIARNYPQWNGGAWVEEEVIFDNYPVGMRKLAIASRGMDSLFWEGEYGAKFANTTVRIEFADEPKIFESDEIPDDTKRYIGPLVHHAARGRLGFMLGRHRMVPDIN